jgi:tetratricopeptide (TPR) repeat protein
VRSRDAAAILRFAPNSGPAWVGVFLFGLVVFAALYAFAAWLIFDVLLGSSKTGVLVAMAVAVALAAVQQVFAIRRFRGSALRAAAAEAAMSTGNVLQRLRSAVLERRGPQLDQMMGSSAVLPRRAKDRFDLSRPDQRALWLRAGERAVTWSAIVKRWDHQPGLLVVLGEPGYGKTVAALSSLTRMNAREGSGQPVAELFPLLEWYRWQAGNRHRSIAKWLVYQLTTTYTDLSVPIAEEFVEQGKVVPLLDGLDEVPNAHRLSCLAAIEAFARPSIDPAAGPSPLARPVALTCRSHEYNQLARDWPDARHVELLALEPEQVAAALAQSTVSGEASDERYPAPDAAMVERLRCPRLLGIALQAANRADGTASRLLTADRTQGEEQLCDLLLAGDTEGFEGAGTEEIRRWLESLADALKRADRERLWLHELYLLFPEPRFQRGYTFRLALGSAFFAGLGVGLLSLIAGGLTPPLTMALVAAVAVALFILRSRLPLAWLPFYEPGAEVLAPAVRVRIGWRGRAMAARDKFVFAVTRWLPGEWAPEDLPLRVVTLVLLLTGGGALAVWLDDLIGEAIFVILGIVTLSLLTTLDVGGQVVTDAVPERLAGAGPEAVIEAAIRRGQLRGFYFLLVATAAGALIGSADGRLGKGALIGLEIGVVLGVIGAVEGGLKAALYRYALPAYLEREGTVPLRLAEFLDWCSQPERGWLRRADAYEFRDGGLVDYLALGAITKRVESLCQQASSDADPSPDLGSALTTLAHRLYEVGRAEQALATMDEAIDRYRQADGGTFREEIADSLGTKAQWLRQLARQEHALSAIGQALELSPLEPTLLSTRAALLRELGRADEAIAASEEALTAIDGSVALTIRFQEILDEPSRELAPLLAAKAQCLHDLGRSDEELTTLAEAVLSYTARLPSDPAVLPELAGVLTLQAACLHATGQAREAMGPSARAVEIYWQLETERPGAFRPQLARSLSTQAAWLRANARMATKQAKLLASQHNQLPPIDNPVDLQPTTVQ